MKETNWTLGNFIKKLREEQGISQKQLSKGLCSSSTLNRIEAGTRDVDIFLCQQILQRLGINPYGMEYRGSKKEFEQLEQRLHIYSLLRENNYLIADEAIGDYQIKWNKDIIKSPLQQQFVKSIQGYIYIFKDELDKATQLIKQAISISIPDWKKENLEDLILGENELLLLYSLCSIYELKEQNQQAFNMRMVLINYVERRFTEPELYIKLICNVAQYLIESGDANMALELCDKGIKCLSSIKRLFMCSDLYYLKGKCQEQLNNKNRLEIIGCFERAYNFYDLLNDFDKAKNIKKYLMEEYGWGHIS